MENLKAAKEQIQDLGSGSARAVAADSEALGRLKRDHDSTDDFEHLEHDSSPIEELKEMAADAGRESVAQLIDVPRAASKIVENLIDTGVRFEHNLLDTSVPADERDLQPLPVTPPPSADFEKHVPEKSAQSSYPFQQANLAPQTDLKAATIAFMETERVPAETPRTESKGANELEIKSAESDECAKLDRLANDFAKLQSDPLQSSDQSLLKSLLTSESVGNNEIGGSSSKTKESIGPKADEKKAETEKKVGKEDDLLAPYSAFSLNKTDEKKPEAQIISAMKPAENLLNFGKDPKNFEGELVGEIKSSVLPVPQKSPEVDFLKDETTQETKVLSKNLISDDSWNVVEKPAKFEKFGREAAVNEPLSKPLPSLPKDATSELFDAFTSNVEQDNFELSNDFITMESSKNKTPYTSGTETGDSEFESEPEPSPAKSQPKPDQSAEKSQKSDTVCQLPAFKSNSVEEDNISYECINELAYDAWFNPECLNPKVAALIYWRDPKKTGVVFGGILGVLLSLAYFSLISVLAYLSLLILTGTVAFRIYKTVLQAVQKTSDGHPFKDILEVDLTLPAEKVHEVADIAVAHANAAVAELRRLFLVEDLLDSLKFGVLLWCLTYLGSWFNGMTLIIYGVVALFTLPKVYETNKTQIDHNLALVRAKINEITAKVKAAIPLGKKIEPAKEE